MNTRVKAAMQRRETDSWTHERSIPNETEGWVYIGQFGIASGATWVDNYRAPTESVGVIEQCTHPRDDNCNTYEVIHVADMDNKIDSKNVLTEFEGETYDTPLHIRKKLFWQSVERAVEWMEANPLE